MSEPPSNTGNTAPATDPIVLKRELLDCDLDWLLAMAASCAAIAACASLLKSFSVDVKI